MAGYVRQSSADIVPTGIVRAAPINNELNALRDAFAHASGHRHDGTSSEGHFVPVIADPDGNNKVLIDSTNNRHGVFVEVSGVSTEQIRFQDGAIVPVTDNDIDLGTPSLGFKDLHIDGVANIDSLFADAATFSSNPVLSAGTANGVPYLNGSKVLTSGSALTFDGTRLTSTTGKFGSGAAANSASLMVNNVTNTATGIQLFQDGIESWIMGMPANSAGLAWSASGSEQMRLTSTGLGIGTSSPDAKLSVNGAASFADGTAAAPAITNIGDLNTGIFFPAADTIAFAEGGLEAMRLDSSGNLGLGVTPSAWGSPYTGSFQMKAGGFLANNQINNVHFGVNAFYNGTNWRYIDTNAASRYEQFNGIHAWFTGPSGTAGNAISFTQAMTLDASGNLYLGTTSGSSRFNLNSGAANWFNMAASSTTASFGIFYKAATSTPVGYIGTDGGGIVSGGSGDNFGIRAEGALVLMAGGAERARIDTSGNLLVGTTSAPTGGFANANVSCSSVFANISGTVSGNIAVLNAAHQGSEYYGLMLKNLTTVASTAIVFINSSNTAAGSVSVTATTAAYNTSSDYRLKNTVAPITGALAKVSALRPVTYKWNIDGSDGEGFIAHELAEVCPQAVTGEKDAVDAEGKPKYQGIDTSFLVATLTAAIQEQQAIITALTARVAALESN